jgi:hypothetical protein
VLSLQNATLLEFSLCLSRACLGKMFVFICKWRTQKELFFMRVSVCCREQLAWVLPSTIGPSAVLISVGVNVLMGGTVELVKLLTAGSYISIITYVNILI